MPMYQIESTAGLIFGVYEGDTPETAFEAMLRDAGSAQDETTGTAADWIIFPARMGDD